MDENTTRSSRPAKAGAEDAAENVDEQGGSTRQLGQTVRRLGRTALFAAVRGASTAAGAAAVAALTWWIQRQ
jgi:hypothetical protein